MVELELLGWLAAADHPVSEATLCWLVTGGPVRMPAGVDVVWPATAVEV
jgi:hypothetical protein